MRTSTTASPSTDTIVSDRKRSQCDAILAHLRKHGRITAIEALNEFGCFRLAARINNLRALGHEISTTTYFDGAKRFAVYRLRKTTNDQVAA